MKLMLRLSLTQIGPRFDRHAKEWLKIKSLKFLVMCIGVCSGDYFVWLREEKFAKIEMPRLIWS
jgi:hypothetical protein